MIIIRILLLPFLFSLFLSGLCYAQDKIRWEKNDDLKWKYFEAKPNINSPMAANTYTNTEFVMSFKDGKFDWKVDCYFSPDKSWVKKELRSEGLLKHEQLHFDIAELNARMIRKELSELNLEGLEDSKKLQLVFEEGLDNLAETQIAYDKDTDHGIILTYQDKWEKNIRAELRKYKKYASSNYNY